MKNIIETYNFLTESFLHSITSKDEASVKSDSDKKIIYHPLYIQFMKAKEVAIGLIEAEPENFDETTGDLFPMDANLYANNAKISFPRALKMSYWTDNERIGIDDLDDYETFRKMFVDEDLDPKDQIKDADFEIMMNDNKSNFAWSSEHGVYFTKDEGFKPY